ncbi:hypothetical protein D3C73_1513040 [compost metagenome]
MSTVQRRRFIRGTRFFLQEKAHINAQSTIPQCVLFFVTESVVDRAGAVGLLQRGEAVLLF